MLYYHWETKDNQKDKTGNIGMTSHSQPMKCNMSDRYLGDRIHCDGEGASVHDTVENRHWRAVSSIMEINSIMEDCSAGILLWESVTIPMILNNAETWTGIKRETMIKLENLQLMMLRYLLKAKKTTPSIALWGDCNTFPMETRIQLKKLNLFIT